MLHSSSKMNTKLPLMLLLFSSLCTFLQITSGARRQLAGHALGQPVGVCYGTYGNNQPTAREAISLLQSSGIQRLRLYGPDHNALQALRNTNIEVVIGVPNEELKYAAADQEYASSWIQNNVQNYPDVSFRYIVVGNGITPVHDRNSQHAQFVLPAMQNILNALSAANLQYRMTVTTALDQSEILSKSFPPSQGEFRPEIRQFIDPIIQFMVKNYNLPLFLVNLHPYFSYIHKKQDIPPQLNGPPRQNTRLNYATFQTGSNAPVQDGPLRYTNVLDAMVDSVYSALEKAGGSRFKLVVSEIGWPTAGGPAAGNEIASIHNNNLINHVLHNGTPKRPQYSIETYIFSVFDENLKEQELLRHWGIFWNNKQPKYQINFQGHQQ